LAAQARAFVDAHDPLPYYSVYGAEEYQGRFVSLQWVADALLRNTSSSRRVLDIGAAYGTFESFVHFLALEEQFTVYIDAIDFLPLLSQQLFESLPELNYKLSNIEIDGFPFTQENEHSYETAAVTTTSDVVEYERRVSLDPENVKYDVIFMGEVLEHWNFNPVPTLRRLKQLLKFDGRIIITTPNGISLPWLLSPTEYRGQANYKTFQDMPDPGQNVTVLDAHVHCYTAQEMHDIARDTGLFMQNLLQQGKQLLVELSVCRACCWHEVFP
jgi:SAM-dependent methyltransferase